MDKQEAQQAAVEAAIAELGERVEKANDKRGDTRKTDRQAAIDHQARVDKAVAELNARIAKANAGRKDTREADRRTALAHQARVDEAVAKLVEDGRVIVR